MQYGDFASVYDRFMDNDQYRKMYKHILAIWNRLELKPDLVLDLACGTGTLTTFFAKSGYDMIGVDNSLEMLAIARQKAEECGVDILYLDQDMREFELYGTVDSVICMCDSLNYLLEESDLERTFKLARNYLNPGGVFIFDMNTEYYFEKVLAQNTFSEITEDAAFIWNNTYNRDGRINCYDISFFVLNGKEMYRRFDESHHERAYDEKTICILLEKAGFNSVQFYDFSNLGEVKANTKRILYTAL